MSEPTSEYMQWEWGVGVVPKIIDEVRSGKKFQIVATETTFRI
jgi:hypothetical protein